MVFDSLKMKNLANRYSKLPDYSCPGVIQLYRNPNLIGERKIIESLILKAPILTREKWIGRLLSPTWSNHLGAWFEIMLFNWLSFFGNVIPEPTLLGKTPDFLLETLEEKIIVEAKVFCISEKERSEEKWRNDLYISLQQIPLNYIVEFIDIALTSQPNIRHFIDETSNWLKEKSEEIFIYIEPNGNRVSMKVIMRSNLNFVTFIDSSGKFLVNPEITREGLHKKVSRYKELTKLGYKIVTACFFEDPRQSSEDLLRGIFGNISISVDRKTGNITRSQFDLTGIHYFNNSVIHKSHCGVILFNFKFLENEKRRKINPVVFIENPYCSSKIKYKEFRIKSNFVLRGMTKDGYEMGWENEESISDSNKNCF